MEVVNLFFIIYIYIRPISCNKRVKYIKDITRWREDMKFMFEWQQQYLTSERSERVRYCFFHENINFPSCSQRVMFFFIIWRLNKVLQIQLGFIANRKYKSTWCQVYINTKPNDAKFCELILDVNTEKILVMT